MKLIFLGSGACFYPKLHNTSAYFTYNNNLVLLDCGETVYERLLQCEDIENYEQIYVVLTHLHADHVGSLGSLLSYCKCVLKKRIYVIYPGEQVCKLLSLMGIADDFYYYKKTLGNELEGLRITPIKVSHALDMECFGYEIQCEKNHVYYSGDASDIPEEILEKFKSGEIQTLYQDTSTHESNSSSHMYVGELEKKIPFEKRKRIVCMHLDSNCHKELEEKGFSTVE